MVRSQQYPEDNERGGHRTGQPPLAGPPFFLPVMNLTADKLLLLMLLVDPKRANYARFAGFYQGFRCLTHSLSRVHQNCFVGIRTRWTLTAIATAIYSAVLYR